MNNFDEENTIEYLVRDLLSGQFAPQRTVAEQPVTYIAADLSHRGAGWHFVPANDLPHQPQDVFIASFVRDALIHLNSSITAQLDCADEVLHRLRAIVLSVRSDGLIKANEEFTAWLRGDCSMAFGPNHEHIPFAERGIIPGGQNSILQ